MAIDTRDKRASVLGHSLPALRPFPLPDASIASNDRLHLAWMYSGIAAFTPPIPATALTGLQVSGLAGAAETLYYIVINDAFGKRQAVVQDIISLEAGRLVNNVGVLTFSVPGYYPRELFKRDGIIELWRAPKGAAFQLAFEQLWFLRDWRLVGSGALEYWSCQAYDGLFLLGDPAQRRGRAIAYAASTSQTDKIGAADNLIKAIARENLGSLATDTNRNLSTYVSIQPDFSLGASVSKAFSWRNTLTVMQELAAASTAAGTYLAFDIVCVIPPSQAGGRTLELQFRTYTAQRGVDHRYPAGQDPVLIGPDYGNLEDYELAFLASEEANYVYALGQGEGVDRAVLTASDTGRIGVSPFGRRETTVDSRQTDSLTALQDDADAALREGRPKISLNGTLVDTDQARYGVQWNYGDYLTAQVRSYAFDARADSLALKFDRDNGDRVFCQIRGEIVGE